MKQLSWKGNFWKKNVKKKYFYKNEKQTIIALWKAKKLIPFCGFQQQRKMYLFSLFNFPISMTRHFDWTQRPLEMFRKSSSSSSWVDAWLFRIISHKSTSRLLPIKCLCCIPRPNFKSCSLDGLESRTISYRALKLKTFPSVGSIKPDSCQQIRCDGPSRIRNDEEGKNEVNFMKSCCVVQQCHWTSRLNKLFNYTNLKKNEH